MNKPQLFCFTYAGGNTAFYDSLEKELSGIELVKLEYAGHGTRYKEPFYNDFDELADDLYKMMEEKYCGCEYSLLGYSMGSITAVEILRRILDDSEMKNPEHVFLAAHEPHSKAELIGYSDDELDEWVKERTIKFGGVPEKLLNNKSFWRVYLPVYRADYTIIRKYRFEELSLKTDIPVTVLYSETDTPREEMDLWKRYFTGRCDYHEFVGNHFFINDHLQEVAQIINIEMQRG